MAFLGRLNERTPWKIDNSRNADHTLSLIPCGIFWDSSLPDSQRVLAIRNGLKPFRMHQAVGRVREQIAIQQQT